MKPSNLLVVSLAALALGAVQAPAQIITSVQFTNAGTNVLSRNGTTIAGVDPAAYWNLDAVTGSPASHSGGAQSTDTATGLLTSTGVASTVTTSISEYGSRDTSGQTFGVSDPNATNDTTLLKDGGITRGIGSSSAAAPLPVTLTLNGLKAADTYSFYVYISAQSSNLPIYSLSLSSGGPTYYAASPNGGNSVGSLTSFQDNASTTDFESSGAGGPISSAAAGAYVSNYILFSGITGVTTDTLTLTETGIYGGGTTFMAAGTPGNSGWALGLSGVQVLDTQLVSAPEPSVMWLWVVGALGLGIQFQRKRLARS